MASKEVKVWKIRPKEGGSWLITTTLSELDDILEHEGTEGAGWDLQRAVMTQEEFAQVSEFDGW